jgi:hypothetical protein
MVDAEIRDFTPLAHFAGENETADENDRFLSRFSAEYRASRNEISYQ